VVRDRGVAIGVCDRQTGLGQAAIERGFIAIRPGARAQLGMFRM
jgi:hypothetical protein